MYSKKLKEISSNHDLAVSINDGMKLIFTNINCSHHSSEETCKDCYPIHYNDRINYIREEIVKAVPPFQSIFRIHISAYEIERKAILFDFRKKKKNFSIFSSIEAYNNKLSQKERLILLQKSSKESKKAA